MVEAHTKRGLSAEEARQKTLLIEYWEDMEILKWWRGQMKTRAGKQAIDKLIYAVIVLHHKNQQHGS